jgi:hypothetical protein
MAINNSFDIDPTKPQGEGAEITDLKKVNPYGVFDFNDKTGEFAKPTDYETEKESYTYNPYVGHVNAFNSVMGALTENKAFSDFNKTFKMQNFLTQQPDVAKLTPRQLYGDEKMFAGLGMMVSNAINSGYTPATESVSSFIQKAVGTKNVQEPIQEPIQNTMQYEESIPVSDPTFTTSLKKTIHAGESGSKEYLAHNKAGSGAWGKYQFVWSHHGKKIKDITGISSGDDFLKNPDAQEKYMDYYLQNSVIPAISKYRDQAAKLGINEIQLGQLIHFRGVAGAKHMLDNPQELYQKMEANNPTAASYLKKNKPKYKEGGPVESKDGKTGMMKAAIALNDAFGNPSANRMVQAYPDEYTFKGDELPFWEQQYQPKEGEKGTHFMSSQGNYAVPFVQKGKDGNLKYNSNANPSDEESMRFNSEEDASYFAEHYKEVAPMMRNYKLGGEYEVDDKELERLKMLGYKFDLL